MRGNTFQEDRKLMDRALKTVEEISRKTLKKERKMEKEKSSSVFYDFTGKTVVVSHSVKVKYNERCLSLILTDLQTQRRLLTVKLNLDQVNDLQAEVDRFLQSLKR